MIFSQSVFFVDLFDFLFDLILLIFKQFYIINEILIDVFLNAFLLVFPDIFECLYLFDGLIDNSIKLDNGVFHGFEFGDIIL